MKTRRETSLIKTIFGAYVQLTSGDIINIMFIMIMSEAPVGLRPVESDLNWCHVIKY